MTGDKNVLIYWHWNTGNNFRVECHPAYMLSDSD